MIIIGVVDPTNDTIFTGSADSGTEPRDPWPEGIAIFDMTTLKFKDSYEANAKQYETPELIAWFYNDTSTQYPATWNSLAVKELFQTRSNQTLNVSNSNTLIPSNSSIGRHSPPSHLSSGSIAGIVIGAIVFVTLCAAVAILIMRKGNQNAGKPNPENFKVELSVEERHRLPASAELPGLATKKYDQHRAELANTGIIELSNEREQSELL